MEPGIGIVLVFSAIVGLLMVYYRMQHTAQEQAEREERQAAILELARKAQAHLTKVETAKTTTTKVNNCDRALGYLSDAAAYPECQQVITNYDSLVARIAAIKKVLPIIAHVEKAYRHQFKGKDSAEKNALLDALYEIETNDVTDADFDIAEVMPEGTGEIVQIEGIEHRLSELGWTRQS